MKKRIKIYIILLISLFLLTGCGETEEDYKNAENPEKFVKESLEDYYKKEMEIIETIEVKDDENHSSTFMSLRLKDDENFIFSACSYWDINAGIPTRHYSYINNYESTYSEKFLKENFSSGEYGTILSEKRNYSYNQKCDLDFNKITLELSDLTKIDKLQEYLKELYAKKEIYSISFDVKYNDKTITIFLNENTKEQENIDKLNSLKNS